LKIDQKFKEAFSNQDDETNAGSSDEEPPEKTATASISQFEENCLSILNRIQIRKWYSRVKI
jgi:hypothetical protein